MRRRRLLLLVALVIELAALSCMAQIADLRAHVITFLLVFAVAMVAFGCACWLLRSGSPGLPSIALIAVVLRLPMLLTQPSLSDDVWRYLHDGRAQVAGTNPYALAPLDSRTLHYRGPDFDRINHPHLVTIYPPAAQVAFLVNAALGSKLLLWRMLLIAAELIMLIALARLLALRGRSLANLALYAWHPLAVVEVAGSAHLEPIGIALLVAGVLAAESGRPVRAGAALGLSIGVKLVTAPLIAVCAFARNSRLLLAGFGTLVVLYAAYWQNGLPFGSLGTFAARWEANASIYAVLAHFTDGHRARILAATLLCCAVAVIRHTRLNSEDRMAACMLALLLISPVVHPWYVLWLLAFVPLVSERWLRSTALAWSATVPLAYWQGSSVILEYLPVYVILAYALFTAARRGYRSETSRPLSERTQQIRA